jgi:hypothetical protein
VTICSPFGEHKKIKKISGTKRISWEGINLPKTVALISTTS